MGTLIGLSMKEFGLELEELASKGVKFDVRSQGYGNIYLSLSWCNVSVYHENEDICGEIIIEKPEADVKISFDYTDAVDFAYREQEEEILAIEDVKYFLQMDESMCMSDIEITISQ